MKYWYSRLLPVGAVAFMAAATAPASAAIIAEGGRFAVATPSAAATQAALEVLQRGGGAVDAAVTAALVVSVTEPQSAGLGGGGFALVRIGSGAIRAVDFRERAPAAATRLMFVPSAPADASATTAPAPAAPVLPPLPAGLTHARDGGLSVAVPGTVRGLANIHARWGKLPWKELTEPAAKLAEGGFVAGYRLAEAASYRSTCLETFGPNPYIASGRPTAAGDIVQLPRLAKALRAIGADPEVAYTGWIADDLVAAVQKTGGILSKSDLAGYSVRVTDPLVYSYRGNDVYGMPLPSSGGLVVEQILGILQTLLPEEEAAWGSPLFWHLYIEASRLAFRDRALKLGDPAFVDVPLKELRSDMYLLKNAMQIKLDKRLDLAPEMSIAPRPATGNQTAQISVATASGDAVSLTFTVNNPFGSCVVAPESEIVLNDEMDDFVTVPGRSNVYGLTGNEWNEIAPGKTPLSSMSPTIVVTSGELSGVLGSPGGPTIISNVAQLLLARYRFQWGARQLPLLPKLHHQWQPDIVRAERSIGKATVDAIAARGHRVEWTDPIGNLQAIFVENGRLIAASDPRGEGDAAAR